MSDERDIDQLVDQVLSAPIAVEPRPHFASRVMFAVRREAELPPLPFPLLRIAAALLLLLAGLVGAVVVNVPERSFPVMTAAPLAAMAVSACFVVAAISVELHRRLAR